MRILERLNADRLAWRSRLEEAINEVSTLPRALDLDRRKQFDDALHARLAELGVFGLGTPREDGGAGGDTIDQVVALETLGRRATSMAVFCVVSFLVTRMLRHYGTSAQKDRYLAPLLQGSSKGPSALPKVAAGPMCWRTRGPPRSVVPVDGC